MTEKIVEVELTKRGYEICIGLDVLDTIGERIKRFQFPLRCVLISNPNLLGLYGERVLTSLKKNGFKTEAITIPEGEEYKNLREVEKIYDRLLSGQLDRYSPLIALGGGVIGDITGFVAATYMRGIPYIQIPTSLLAQVDSSIGGKTAVNHSLGKNMIGAFYQPKGVFIDLNVLKTLPEIEFRCGMSEIIKYGIISDETLFTYLEINREKIKSHDLNALQYIIESSCKIKALIVSKDECEEGLRAVLNFGHSIGHVLESLTGYKKYKHGEAVAIGMVAASYISYEMGLCGMEDVGRVRNLIESYDLPVKLPEINIKELLKAIHYDKKVKDKKVKLILMKKPGLVEIKDDVSDKIILKGLMNL